MCQSCIAMDKTYSLLLVLSFVDLQAGAGIKDDYEKYTIKLNHEFVSRIKNDKFQTDRDTQIESDSDDHNLKPRAQMWEWLNHRRKTIVKKSVPVIQKYNKSAAAHALKILSPDKPGRRKFLKESWIEALKATANGAGPNGQNGNHQHHQQHQAITPGAKVDHRVMVSGANDRVMNDQPHHHNHQRHHHHREKSPVSRGPYVPPPPQKKPAKPCIKPRRAAAGEDAVEKKRVRWHLPSPRSPKPPAGPKQIVIGGDPAATLEPDGGGGGDALSRHLAQDTRNAKAMKRMESKKSVSDWLSKMPGDHELDHPETHHS